MDECWFGARGKRHELGRCHFHRRKHQALLAYEEGTMNRWIVLALGLGFTSGEVRASVVVVAFPVPREIYDDGIGPDGSLNLSGRFDPIDIDGNGTVDLTLGSSFSSIGIRTERGNRIVIRLNPPPSLAGPPVPVPAGSIIGASIFSVDTIDLLWTSTDFLGGYVSPGENAFAGISQVLNTGERSSFNGRGALGFEFEAADGIHYGYMDISSVTGYAGLTLYGWAYESRPGIEIVAGQVPEPTGAPVLVAVACVAGMQRGRERRKGTLGSFS